MTKSWAVLVLATLPAFVAAQQVPKPEFDDPRLQTITYDPAGAVRLVAFANSTLTVMLLPGDRIERVALSDPAAFEVKVAGRGDGLNIVPRHANASARLQVGTAQRSYEFNLATGDGLAAAYLVRFVPVGTAALSATVNAQPAVTGTYRLAGERALMPSRLGDDGERTYMEWDKSQSMPAVFGIGANGEEEVVDGYMRQGIFTIDRIYAELVFRIDKKRALARRIRDVRPE